jgi:hypothetical protein
VVNGELVPDPVYAPLQSANNALNTDVVAGLIDGLLSDHAGWLKDATTTAFPAGTKLLKVTLRGQAAIVDLGGAAAKTNAQQGNYMQAQLRATLASNAYSSPLARNVALYINGRYVYPGGVSNISLVSRGQLVYQSGPDTVSGVGGNTPLAAPGQIGSAQITALASIEGGTVAVAVRSGRGCAVDFLPAAGQSAGASRSRRIPDSTGPCTSLSWDRNGNLWAVAGGHIWLLRSRTHSRWLTVSNPPGLTSGGNSGSSILSMQLAPDGVRAALLVKTGGVNRVLLAAVVFNVNGPQMVNNAKGPQGENSKGRPKLSVSLGPAVPAWAGLSRPTALSWYSPYDLVVLTRSGVWQVPLTGGAGRLLGAAPAGAVSLASDGIALAIGTSEHGRYALYDSTNGGNSWKSISSSNLFPTYPTYGIPQN